MNIGFIGLGNVGGKLAGSLLRNKFNLTVRDLDKNLTKQFKDSGAKIANSAKELAEENLRELMDAHLRGKVRLRLAGDLHHYTRHSPIFSSFSPMSNAKRSVSLSDKEPNKHDHVASANDPELIVSGGGGAFLHGTRKLPFWMHRTISPQLFDNGHLLI